MNGGRTHGGPKSRKTTTTTTTNTQSHKQNPSSTQQLAAQSTLLSIPNTLFALLARSLTLSHMQWVAMGLACSLPLPHMCEWMQWRKSENNNNTCQRTWMKWMKFLARAPFFFSVCNDIFKCPTLIMNVCVCVFVLFTFSFFFFPQPLKWESEIGMQASKQQ